MTTYRDFNERQDSLNYARFFEDFVNPYTAGNWTAHTAGTVTTPAVSTDDAGGVLDLRITSTAATDMAHYRTKTPVVFQRGKKLKAQGRFVGADFAKAVTGLVFGLADGSGSAFAATNKILISVVEGAIIAQVGTDTKEADVAENLADDDAVVFEIYYDGGETIQFYKNGKRFAAFNVEGAPDDGTDLFLVFGVGNTGGDTVTKSLDVDFVGFEAER